MINQIQKDLQVRAKLVTEGYKQAGEAGTKVEQYLGKA